VEVYKYFNKAPPKGGIPTWEAGGKLNFDKRGTFVPPTTGRMGKQSTLSAAGNVFNFSPQHKKTIRESNKSILGGLSSPHDFKMSLIGTNNHDELLRKGTIYQQSTTSFNHTSQMQSTNNLNQNVSKDTKFISKEPEINIKLVKELQKRVVLQDSEDRWFLNPQYKIHLKPGTKLMISLMQENEKLTKKLFERVNFVIMISKVNSFII
jgi:hypothetical protein